MLVFALLLRYDWVSATEIDAVSFPLWSGYGVTAEDAHRIVVSILTQDEHTVIFDAGRQSRPLTRETIIAFAVWDPEQVRTSLSGPAGDSLEGGSFS